MTAIVCEVCEVAPVRAAVLHRRRAVHLCRRCLPVVLVGRRVRETLAMKARRLCRSGHVHVVRRSDRLVVAHVVGDTGRTYIVSLVGDNAPSCSCPAGARHVRCSHVIAASAVAR